MALHKKLSKPTKRWVISAICIVTAAAIGAGIFLIAGRRGGGEPVGVYPFHMVGMTEYWGDSMETYGPVDTDRIQTVYLSETQIVTEIFVQPGDTVKKGDLLMSFDTTLTDLALERERLGVERLRLQLQDAIEQLANINSMVPMVIPEPEENPPETDLGTELTQPWQIGNNKDYDGAAEERAIVVWLRSDTGMGDDLWLALHQEAVRLQTANAAAATPPPADPNAPETTPEPNGTADPNAPVPTPSAPPQVNVTEFYAVLKITDQNRALGGREVWQGVKLNWDGSRFTFQFFDAMGVPDYTAVEGETEEEPEFDFGSGFTAGQIAEMRNEQEKAIRELEFQIKMAEAEYQIKLAEAEDGNVYARIDGQVVSVLDPEEAFATMQPVLKVSGGGGFYIRVTISELEMDTILIGQEVTVNDWNTGMTYMGTVDSISQSPDPGGLAYNFTGMGNPNTTYYPMKIFVDGSADLQEGSYVSVTYSAGESTNGIYLENPFLRTEGGESYVYVRGEDGRLEQRFVVTGKSLWGSYTEILSGLTEEDFVAFPYGKTVKPGAATAESDLSELYGY